jgi:hypothetical protein
VAVCHHLPGLVDGAGEAGPQHDRVEPPFEQLDQVLAGLARPAHRLADDPPELPLAQVVLAPQPLLLQQLQPVRARVAAPPSVYAGRVRAPFEVAGRLRRQRDAECAGQPRNRPGFHA